MFHSCYTAVSLVVVGQFTKWSLWVGSRSHQRWKWAWRFFRRESSTKWSPATWLRRHPAPLLSGRPFHCVWCRRPFRNWIKWGKKQVNELQNYLNFEDYNWRGFLICMLLGNVWKLTENPAEGCHLFNFLTTDLISLKIWIWYQSIAEMMTNRLKCVSSLKNLNQPRYRIYKNDPHPSDQLIHPISISSRFDCNWSERTYLKA